jgi:hypothetical protein
MSTVCYEQKLQLHDIEQKHKNTEQQYKLYVRHLHGRLESTQHELERERKASEVINQQFLELQDWHNELQKDCNRREQSERTAHAFADEVSRQVKGLHDGRPIHDLIIESVGNAHLVNRLSGQYTEEETITELKRVMEENIDLQRHHMELCEQFEAVSKKVEKGDKEIVDLRKALELTTEDKQRKKTRRGKGKPLLEE